MKKDYDKCAKTRIFENGDLVLVRIPGMTNKLSESWEGPCEILKKVSAVNYANGVPGKNKRGKVIHVNNTKKFVQSTAHVLRLVVADAGEVELEKKVALIGDKLEEEQQKDLGKLLNKWNDILSKKPGLTTAVQHSIFTGNISDLCPYRLAPQWTDQVRAEIRDLLQTGIIVQSTSPWSAPIVPIRKPDGSVHLCVDFRKLNAHTVPCPYYIPLVEELIDKISEAKCLSKLDLAKDFYQVPMAEDYRMKTAFLTLFGKYEFTRMPFGLSNAPFTFQKIQIFTFFPLFFF